MDISHAHQLNWYSLNVTIRLLTDSFDSYDIVHTPQSKQSTVHHNYIKRFRAKNGQYSRPHRDIKTISFKIDVSFTERSEITTVQKNKIVRGIGYPFSRISFLVMPMKSQRGLDIVA